MSEFLAIRLSKNRSSPIRWLVWSTNLNEVIASGELSSENELDTLSSYAAQRTTILLLDSQDVMVIEADIPAGASRQLNSMLPYLLEDNIAQDVDDIHFTLLKKSSDKAQVAAVDRHYLSTVMQHFNDAGIEVRKVLPDALCLPVLEEAISAVQIDNHWLFRKSDYQSISVDNEWLSLFFESEWFNDQEPQTISAFSALPQTISDNQVTFDNVVWKAEQPELVMALLTKGAITSRSNLLTGSFKPQSSTFRNIKVWRPAAIAACLFLIIFSVNQYLKVTHNEALVKSYRAESERIFRTIFPDKKRIPTVTYLKGQINSEENRLQGEGSSDSVLDWLAHLPGTLDGSSVEIQSIRYDANREEMRIEALMNDFQTFEVIRTKLADTFSVSQGPLDKKGNKVSGSFVLGRKQ